MGNKNQWQKIIPRFKKASRIVPEPVLSRNYCAIYGTLPNEQVSAEYFEGGEEDDQGIARDLKKENKMKRMIFGKNPVYVHTIKYKQTEGAGENDWRGKMTEATKLIQNGLQSIESKIDG